MATFELKDADVAAVYFRSGDPRKGTERLRLAPFLLVTYDDGTSGCVPYPILSQTNRGAQYTAKDFEVDRIEIYDGDQVSEYMQFGIF